MIKKKVSENTTPNIFIEQYKPKSIQGTLTPYLLINSEFHYKSNFGSRTTTKKPKQNKRKYKQWKDKTKDDPNETKVSHSDYNEIYEKYDCNLVNENIRTIIASSCVRFVV